MFVVLHALTLTHNTLSIHTHTCVLKASPMSLVLYAAVVAVVVAVVINLKIVDGISAKMFQRKMFGRLVGCMDGCVAGYCPSVVSAFTDWLCGMEGMDWIGLANGIANGIIKINVIILFIFVNI